MTKAATTVLVWTALLFGNVAAQSNRFIIREAFVDAGGSRDEPEWICCVSTKTTVSQMTINSLDGYPEESLQTHRWGEGGSYNYTIPNLNPSETYKVNLGFVETNPINCAIGKRVYDIALQGTVLYRDFDIAQEAELNCATPIILSEMVTANSEGEIVVHFVEKVEFPLVSFIEVLSLATFEDFTEQIVLIDAGVNDTEFLVGDTGISSKLSLPIELSAVPGGYPEQLFQTHRWGRPFPGGVAGDFFSYEVKNLTPSTWYRVSLGFAETNPVNCAFFNRVFEVRLQDELVLIDFDVFGEIGCSAGLIKSFLTTADVNGIIKADFIKSLTEQPFVAFLQVLAIPTPPVRSINAGNDTSSADVMIMGNSRTTFSATPIVGGAEAGQDETSFQSHRWGDNDDFSYILKNLEPQRTYEIRLGFAEINPLNCVVGNRIFNVAIQDELVLENFDVFGETGQCFSAITKSFNSRTSETGEFVIDFIRGPVEFPYIALIEVYGPTAALVIDVGSESMDQPSLVSGNKTFVGSSSTDIFQSELYGLEMTPFQTNRFGSGDFSYTVGGFVPGISYHVSLGFAEIHDSNCMVGRRLFDVEINGEIVLDNFDVFNEAGCKVALVEYFEATATSNGEIQIKFLSGGENNPMVSFIEVSDTPPPTSHTSVPTLVYDIDVGSADGDMVEWQEFVTDTSAEEIPKWDQTTTNPILIAGTPNPRPFWTHGWLFDDFSYRIPELAPGSPYLVQLGWAEVYEPNCEAQKRVFHVEINDMRVLTGMDVFSTVGCNAAFVKVFPAVADENGEIVIKHADIGSGNPFLSIIRIFTGYVPP